jgi:pyridoxal phosphate enzyme (YggS family)
VTIAADLASVRGRLDAACRRAGRDPAAVTLVAVSKKQPPEAIREAYAAGQRDFGENYAQELRDKQAALADLAGIRWHALGPLQTNKAKYVAGKVALLHTLDRVDLAQELARRAGGAKVRALVEVNIGREPQKGGVLPEELPERLAALAAVPGIELAGLMCIPPAADDAEASRPHYRALRELRDRLLPGGELSMGMSGDFEVAVEEGATLVRVGTAIFGERQRRPSAVAPV